MLCHRKPCPKQVSRPDLRLSGICNADPLYRSTTGVTLASRSRLVASGSWNTASMKGSPEIGTARRVVSVAFLGTRHGQCTHPMGELAHGPTRNHEKGAVSTIIASKTDSISMAPPDIFETKPNIAWII